MLAFGLSSGVVPAPVGHAVDALTEGLRVVARWAAIGVCSGVLFASSVMFAERREVLSRLSQHHFARWGMLAGALGSAAVVAGFAALLPSGFIAERAWTFAAPFAAVPLLGGMLGRTLAAQMLRAARGEGRAPALLQLEQSA
jgi:hypothetical protein